MARTLDELVLAMSADVRRLEKGLDKAQGKFDRTANTIEKRERALSKQLAEMGKDAGAGLAKASLVATVALTAIATYAIRVAGDAAEIQNAFEVAFGESAKEAEAFAGKLAKSVGRSVTDVQESMTRLQLVITGMGVGGKQALSIVEALSARAIDMGSLFNVEDAEAFASIISGISGESEPLKKFGVVLNETAVKAELLRLGFKGNAEHASEAAKVIARTNLILQKTAVAQGDAANTAESANNQMKRARAEFHEAAITLGKQLLPAFTSATKATADLLVEFGKLPDSVKLGGLALLGLVAASGPIAATVAGLIKLIGYAKAASVAMAGVTGATAAAGARTAVAGAGVAAGVAGGVAGGALLFGYEASSRGDRFKHLSGLNSPSQRFGRSTEQLQADLAELKKDEAAGVKAGRTSYATKLIKKVEEQLSSRVKGAAGAVQAEIDKASKDALKDLGGGFALSGDQLSAAGGKGGAAKKAADAAAAAARQAAQQNDRYNSEMARAQDRALALQKMLNISIEDRTQVELDRVAGEALARTEDLKLAVQKKELTQAQADDIAAAEDKARSAERTVILSEQEEDLRKERLAQERALMDLTAELIGIQAGSARTLKARRALEQQLLEMHQRAARADLEAGFKDNPNISAEAQVAQRTALDQVQAAQRTEVDRRNQGPLDQFADSAVRGTDEVNEALQRMATEGLETLNAGLVDAIMNSKSLGDLASNVFKQIAADLLSMTIRQSITGPIAAALGGGKIPGFKNGTNSAPGGLAYVHRDELINLPRGSQVIPSHTLRALGNLSVPKGGGGVYAPMQFDMRGAVVTEQLLAQMNQIAAQGAMMGARGGSSMAQADLARRARRRL